MIDLSGIFLTPLHASNKSFIKVVGSGTGLGKSYSCILSLQKYVSQFQHLNDKSVLALYTSPQHNQISFPETVAQLLEANNTTIIKVKPISPIALSNIDSETNAYEIAKGLFFKSDGLANRLFLNLLDIAKKIDTATKKIPNNTSLEKTLASVRSGKAVIDGILGKIEHYKNMNDGSDEKIFESVVDKYERIENYKEQNNKLQERLKLLTIALQSILLNSYKNNLFYTEIHQSLSKPSLKKFREVTASFYPFLHYQLSDTKHTLLGMTVAKLMAQHHVFTPKFNPKNNTLYWSVRPVSLEDIINDTSDFSSKSREQLSLANDSILGLRDLQPGCHKLFDTEVHLYMDESDSAKKIISENLHNNYDDRGIVQASGALAKESAHVLYDPHHKSLSERIPDTDIEAYRYLNSGNDDDSIERQIGKDILRKIQDSIIRYISSSDWDQSERNRDLLEEDINKDIRFIARAMLTAPFCTVEAGIDRSVFEMTSAFGGEMFGFIGSRNIDNYVMIATPGSIRITQREYLQQDQKCIPLKNFFLLITINWFLFLSLSRHRGGEKADQQFHVQIIEHVNKLLSSFNSDVATHHVEVFKKLIKSFYREKSNGLISVAKPFRVKFLRAQGKDKTNDQIYHTECALESIARSSLFRGKDSGVFSPKHMDIDILFNDETASFNQIHIKPIDIKNAYCKASSIFGMVQVDNRDYTIAQDKCHVVFPIKYRRESAESYLIKLVAGNERRVCCFLMSATGAYENSHIPAWSMDALRYLAEEFKVDFLKMNQDDYHITAAKQRERGKLKQIDFKSFDDLSDGDFIHIAKYAENSHIKKMKENGDDSDSDSKYKISKSTIDHLRSLRNRHKRHELNNILKGLGFIHNQSGHNDVKQPRFALTLAQTHQKFSAVLNIFTCSKMTGENRQYKIENILKDDSDTEHASTGYGIYRLSTLGSTSKFITKPRDTIIICYSAALDRILAKMYKTKTYIVQSTEYKIKKLLGMDPHELLPDASATDFNALNYFLNFYHDCNIYIVSAYESAARGINLIVNKETGLLKKHKANSDKKYKPRDLDYIFMAAPPFYSEIRLNLSSGMDSKTSQERYFANCDRYFHYIEWLARRFHHQPDRQLLNNEVDLMKPIDDSDADVYFSQQHALSVFSALQQGLGRIERTNAKQDQIVFLCNGVTEVICNGIDAIRYGYDDKNTEQLIGAMSVVNSSLARKVLSHELNLSEKLSDNSVFSMEISQQRFENLKRESFLKAIKYYRNFESCKDIDAKTLLEIEFYEAFRSSKIWSEGYETYSASLSSVISRMPKGLGSNYSKILEMMFSRHYKPLDHYIAYAGGGTLDLNMQFNNKIHAEVNPYFTNVADNQYIYPTPWFLPDLEGNYGEYVVQLALKRLISNGNIVQLNRFDHEIARKGYELADFFIQAGDCIVGIDAKHFLSQRAQAIKCKEDRDWTLQFNQKLQRNQDYLQSLVEHEQRVKLVAINTASTERGKDGLKTVGVDCYLSNSESDISTIVSHLGTLIAAGVLK